MYLKPVLVADDQSTEAPAFDCYPIYVTPTPTAPPAGGGPQKGEPMLFFKAISSLAPRMEAQPPGTHPRGPIPCLASG